MKKTISTFSLAAIAALTFSGCGSSQNRATINFEPTNLDNLGSNYVYEGWLIVDGQAISTGTFTTDPDNPTKVQSFSVFEEDLNNAENFVLTVEPANDTDPAPSELKILATGSPLTSTRTTATVASSPLAIDFTQNTTGTFILAAPTADANDTANAQALGISDINQAGVWFLDGTSGTPVGSLSLPPLPADYVYEGWAVFQGKPVSTGTFTDSNVSDSGNPFSGLNPAPNYPGEDFLHDRAQNPTGLTFPADITSAAIVITVEPANDLEPDTPFPIKPLLNNDAAKTTGGATNHNLDKSALPTLTIIR